ncbi:hypothetical protein WBJ53_15860 [Spirosoma sp. SC4-14]|uniref:tetratricopeptide repeat protein n=1 Tax=Spirosoma sp. SC4-14 TaxID=3128900 RepID=UPI0030CCC52E
MKYYFLSLLLIVSPRVVQAQVLSDQNVQPVILKALDSIYEGNFQEADQPIAQLRGRYPEHPIVPLLQAMKLKWQFLPINENPKAVAQFKLACQQSIVLAGKLLERNKKDPEGTFFALTAHSYLALIFNNDGQTMKAVNESKKAYGFMKTGFSLIEQNPEFYFTTGLYNYYVERYPLDNPLIKPLMWFFQDGDMALGLKQMDMASRRAVFTRIETCFYLSHIYLEQESQPERAAYYTRILAERFPHNPVFVLRHAESLMLAGRYQEAQTMVEQLKHLPHPMLPMPIAVLEGLLLEKREKNNREAAGHYQAALHMPYVANYTREYHAFAEAGLARIAARSGDSKQAQAHYKKALKPAEYKSTIREAKQYMAH